MIGGIIGSLEAEIINCYNVGNIITQCQYVGGLAGRNSNQTVIIKNSYNIGQVTGSSYVNEIIGDQRYGTTTIENCYTSSDTFSYRDLGTAFKEDINNINNGYPILNWQ